MKCPHCLVEINPDFKDSDLGDDSEGSWTLSYMICPNSKCQKFIIILKLHISKGNGKSIYFENLEYIVWPTTSSRQPVPSSVDPIFSNDYKEACLIMDISPKASAALSRRCLQNILREKAGINKGDLANEIHQVIDSKKLPTYLSENIDAVRHLGNFAAHPMKSTSTGEIIDVEPGEAEWLLDVIELLFDFYFVQPDIAKSKKDALNKKLSDAGKPPMK